VKQKEQRPSIETILSHIGITHDNVRVDAYNHWRRFIEFCRKYSGKTWKDDIRPKLRSWIGVDYRYIDDYLESCMSWGILELDDGILVFRGLPDPEESDRESETPFMDAVKQGKIKPRKDVPDS